MTTDLVRTKLAQTVKVGSLQDLVRAKASDIVSQLIDVSGSMGGEGGRMRNGKLRIEGLKEVVKDIRAERQVKLIAFGGNRGAWLTDGVPDPSGGTPLHEGIDLARAQNCGRVVVISDGQPDSEHRALEAAAKFGGQIDVVFVGDPGGWGEDFLRRLAESTGGTEWHGDLSQPKELARGVIGLLSGDVEDEKGAIEL